MPSCLGAAGPPSPTRTVCCGFYCGAISRSTMTRPGGTADPLDALLALEARRFRYASTYDPILAMSASRVDPLPHQIDAVYGRLLRMPRIRYLFAHDPGAGKTVMAGLALKELKMRHRIRRVLIVVPGQLREQWRWEMLDKFDERFEVVDRRRYGEAGGARVWDADQVITSIDFAKRSDILESLGTARFDLVIVDEAHKMSAYSTGRSTNKTRRYRLGETLSDISENLLFLTATPHKGDPANFRLLLDLLEPGYFAADEMMAGSVRDGDNPLFLRRAKEDMVDFGGRPLFVPRMVSTPDVSLSPEERRLYGSLSRYVHEQYNLALQSAKGHNVTFALIILQRRFASSIHALLESLRRRRDRLHQLLQGAGKAAEIMREAGEDTMLYMDRMDELSEEERWDEEKKWEVLSVARSRDELEAEIKTLEDIMSQADRIMRRGAETKLAQLRETMETLDRNDPDEKVLVFTESKDTLDYLAARMREWGYDVNTIHGSMAPAARKEAEAVFRDRTRVMVATEAAGEGINLQFCHIMVNYDLPWNPNRLEQRMGRIHRYGQRRPVRVFNMVYADTREGQIMQTLFAKLQEIKEAMGSDKVFDVISDIIPGRSLSQMLLDTAVNSRSQDQIMRELGEAVAPDSERIREYMKDGLATKYMDLTPLRDVRDAAREGRLVPGYAAQILALVLGRAGGSVTHVSDGVASVRMPEEMALRAGYRTATLPAVAFDKRTRMMHPGAELVTVGHPLFETALDWARGLYGADSVAVFTDPYGTDGYMVFHEGEVVDGTGRAAAKMMTACVCDGDGAREVPPSAILDLDMGGAPAAPAGHEAAVRESEGVAASALAAQVDRVRKEREGRSASSEKYGLASMDILLQKIGDDIVGLLAKKKAGGNVNLAIHNKREDRKKYLLAKARLRRRTRMEGDLSAGRPSLAGVIRVVPGPAEEVRARLRALDAAMRFEAGRDASPRDVHGSGRGFDIVSEGQEPRYILARPVLDGYVRIMPNEWLRAAMLAGLCHLYVADGDNMIVVQDPAGTLSPEARADGYYVDVGTLPTGR